MHSNIGRIYSLLTTLLLSAFFTASAQTLTITNRVQIYSGLTNTIVTMTGRCELRLTATNTPLSGCTINLNSVDSFLVLPGIKPSVVVSTYLSQVKISGAAAVADSNCRVVEYAMGAIVLPHSSSFQPLTVFRAPYLNGTSLSLSQYTYYKSGLGALYANISSFRLKRGYMAVFAQAENGTGISKTYVAQDGDMEVSVLPPEFNHSVRFVYVTPWRWSAKKGIAGDPGISQLNIRWDYNWNISKNSSRDDEYVAIRQQRYWPSLSQNWQTLGVNTVLGYNEPDHTDQANMAVGDAIYSWPDLLGTGLRVGSPAPSDGGYSSWLYPFMTQADAANLRVDFVAVHYYRCYNPADPAGAATQLYNALKGVYDQTKRPIWVTEWNNGANWTTCGDPTFAQQQAAIAAIINMLDTTPFVERYALYNWVENVRSVVDTNGFITAAGVTYRDQQSPIGYVQALQNNGTRSFTQLRFETNTLDSSGYGNNGISAGSPAYTNGHSGQAIVFDGTNTVVTLPPNVATNSAFTFAAWINWSGGANWQRIFDFGNSTTHYMFLSPNAAGTNLRFAIANGGGEQIVQTAPLAQNQWQHVAITLSGGTAKLYVNGVLAAQNTSMSITPASFAPRVNRLGKSQFYVDPLFQGAMDDVLITDYALSAAQIAALQTNTPPQFTNTIFARGTGTEGIAYSNTMAGTATDADPGATLTYSKATGPAWLNIAADGTMTGAPTSADGGTNYFTVAVTDAAGQNGYTLATVVVTTLTGSGSWTADANASWSETNRWSDNIVVSGAGQTANFSTINITANRTVTLDTSRSIGTLRFSDTSGTQFWTITNSSDSTLTLNSGSATSPAIVVTNTATIAASLAGTNGYTKSGPGTLILSGNNSLSGTVNIDTGSSSANDGITRLAGPGALGNAKLLQIGNNNSGTSTLQLDGSAGSITVNADVSVTCRNSGVVTIENLAGTNIFNGNILLNVGGNTHTVQSDSGLLVFTGTNMFVGSLTGSRTYFFTGAGNHLLVGPVVNSANGAPIALAKSGTGMLILAGVNTYTNGTTLAGGTLLVDGVLPAGSLTISSGTTLGGNGHIYPVVTLPFTATLSPGDNSGITLTNNNDGGILTNNIAVGLLTIHNNVTLQAGSTCLFEIDQSSAVTNDQLAVTGTLNYGGTLVVTNLSGSLVGGYTFKLFNAVSSSGDFTTLSGSPGVGLDWKFNPANGVLTVYSTVSPAIGLSVANDQLQLSWPADHIGWTLQAQTNDVTAGLGNNWVSIPATTTTTQFTVPLDTGNAAVFYRLSYQ
jgi:autotransporter-associated beta strand protein